MHHHRRPAFHQDLAAIDIGHGDIRLEVESHAVQIEHRRQCQRPALADTEISQRSKIQRCGHAGGGKAVGLEKMLAHPLIADIDPGFHSVEINDQLGPSVRCHQSTQAGKTVSLGNLAGLDGHEGEGGALGVELPVPARDRRGAGGDEAEAGEEGGQAHDRLLGVDMPGTCAPCRRCSRPSRGNSGKSCESADQGPLGTGQAR